MSAGKNSKHIKNRFSLIADKVAQWELEIRHLGTKRMRADVNTKPLQGEQFRIFRADMMGVPVDYDDDEERKRTHPKLLPKTPEPGTLSDSDAKVLEDAGVVKGVLRGCKAESAREQATGPETSGRSVLSDTKHGPGNRPWWK